MVVVCSVRGCGKTKAKDGVSLYRFPSVNMNSRLSQSLKDLQLKRCKAWIFAIKKPNITLEGCVYRRVCSEHFLSGKPAEIDDLGNPDWVPTRKLGYKIPLVTQKRKYEPKPPMIINITSPAQSSTTTTTISPISKTTPRPIKEDSNSDPDPQFKAKIPRMSQESESDSESESQSPVDKILFFNFDYLNKNGKADMVFKLTNESASSSSDNSEEDTQVSENESENVRMSGSNVVRKPFIQKLVKETEPTSKTQSTQTDLTWEALEKLERELLELLKQMERNNIVIAT